MAKLLVTSTDMHILTDEVFKQVGVGACLVHQTKQNNSHADKADHTDIIVLTQGNPPIKIKVASKYIDYLTPPLLF